MKKLISFTYIVLLATVAFADDGAQAQQDSVNITDQMNEMREISVTKNQEEQDQKNVDWEHHKEFLHYMDLNYTK